MAGGFQNSWCVGDFKLLGDLEVYALGAEEACWNFQAMGNGNSGSSSPITGETISW